jgi:hypothetical protein
MHAREIFQEESICISVTLTTMPWGVHMATKLGWSLKHTMLWNGQHWQSNKVMPGESKTFKQVVHRSLEQ